MKLKGLLLIAVVAAAVVLTGMAGARAGALLKAQPTAVAVVDVQKVFDALTEKKEIEADLKSKYDDFVDKSNKQKQELSKYDDDLKLLQAGTSAYTKKEEEYEQKALEYQSWVALQQSKSTRDRALLLENIYRKLLDALGRVAQQEGYDLVMFKEPPADFRNAKPETISTNIQIRKLLWNKTELDISDSVLQIMNNEYKNPRKP